MNARDRLFTALMDDCGCAPSEEMKQWANMFIDDYAHELAEKIRRVIYAELDGLDSDEPRSFMRAIDAADLIDPETENGS